MSRPAQNSGLYGSMRSRAGGVASPRLAQTVGCIGICDQEQERSNRQRSGGLAKRGEGPVCRGPATLAITREIDDM